MPPRQLQLFSPSASASRPFTRWHRKIDVVQICARCGRPIITQRRTTKGVVSEYVSADNCCWNCSRAPVDNR